MEALGSSGRATHDQQPQQQLSVATDGPFGAVMQRISRQGVKIPAKVYNHMPELLDMPYGVTKPMRVQLVVLPPQAADVTPDTPALEVIEIKQGATVRRGKGSSTTDSFTMAGLSLTGSAPARAGHFVRGVRKLGEWHVQVLCSPELPPELATAKQEQDQQRLANRRASAGTKPSDSEQHHQQQCAGARSAAAALVARATARRPARATPTPAAAAAAEAAGGAGVQPAAATAAASARAGSEVAPCVGQLIVQMNSSCYIPRTFVMQHMPALGALPAGSSNTISLQLVLLPAGASDITISSTAPGSTNSSGGGEAAGGQQQPQPLTVAQAEVAAAAAGHDVIELRHGVTVRKGSRASRGATDAFMLSGLPLAYCKPVKEGWFLRGVRRLGDWRVQLLCSPELPPEMQTAKLAMEQQRRQTIRDKKRKQQDDQEQQQQEQQRQRRLELQHRRQEMLQQQRQELELAAAAAAGHTVAAAAGSVGGSGQAAMLGSPAATPKPVRQRSLLPIGPLPGSGGSGKQQLLSSPRLLSPHGSFGGNSSSSMGSKRPSALAKGDDRPGRELRRLGSSSSAGNRCQPPARDRSRSSERDRNRDGDADRDRDRDRDRGAYEGLSRGRGHPWPADGDDQWPQRYQPRVQVPAKQERLLLFKSARVRVLRELQQVNGDWERRCRGGFPPCKWWSGAAGSCTDGSRCPAAASHALGHATPHYLDCARALEHWGFLPDAAGRHMIQPNHFTPTPAAFEAAGLRPPPHLWRGSPPRSPRSRPLQHPAGWQDGWCWRDEPLAPPPPWGWQQQHPEQWQQLPEQRLLFEQQQRQQQQLPGQLPDEAPAQEFCLSDEVTDELEPLSPVAAPPPPPPPSPPPPLVADPTLPARDQQQQQQQQCQQQQSASTSDGSSLGRQLPADAGPLPFPMPCVQQQQMKVEEPAWLTALVAPDTAAAGAAAGVAAGAAVKQEAVSPCYSRLAAHDCFLMPPPVEPLPAVVEQLRSPLLSPFAAAAAVAAAAKAADAEAAAAAEAEAAGAGDMSCYAATASVEPGGFDVCGDGGAAAQQAPLQERQNSTQLLEQPVDGLILQQQPQQQQQQQQSQPQPAGQLLPALPPGCGELTDECVDALIDLLNVLDMSFPDESLDVVGCVEALEAIQQQPAAAARFMRWGYRLLASAARTDNQQQALKAVKQWLLKPGPSTL